MDKQAAHMLAAEMQAVVSKCYYVERQGKPRGRGGEMNEVDCVKADI